MYGQSFSDLIHQMRESLTLHNPEWVTRKDYDIVRMGIHGNHGYMEGKTVRDAIDYFEKRASVASLDEQLNPLEALGVILLLESDYLR